MKTEERHELKKNELNEILAKIEPYWRAIVGGIVILFTVIVATALISSSQRRAKEAGWEAYFAASANRDPDMLKSLAEAQGSGAVVPWAFYTSGQGRLVDAARQVATDRTLAQQNFQEAIEDFQKAVDNAGNYELIKKQAMWGLAQAQEGLAQLDEAKKQFTKIVETWPGSAIAQRAQDRIDRLNDPATKDFYDWYFAQTPPTATPPSTSPTSPLQFGSPPRDPDFSIPDIGDDSAAPSTDDLIPSGVNDSSSLPGTIPAPDAEQDPADPGSDEPADSEPTDSEPADSEPADSEPTDIPPTSDASEAVQETETPDSETPD